MIYVSRDKSCKRDNCARFEDPGYCIVYNQKHLGVKTYPCGCVAYINKYYREANVPELVWIDFFNAILPEGEKLVSFSLDRICKNPKKKKHKKRSV